MRDNETENRRRQVTPTRALALMMLGCTLGAATAQSTVTAHTPQSSEQPNADQPPSSPWLDEVRRQRRAWEERRQSARQVFEARRRRQDHWSTTQQDAWREDIRRRREARREQMAQEREYFRNLLPYEGPPWATLTEPPDSLPGSAPMLTQEPGGPSPDFGPPEALIVEPPPPPPPHTPPDWDNLWYFRGF